MAGRLESKLQSTPAITCMKTLLVAFNFVFWVSGVAILALGIWTKVELYMYMELTDHYYVEAPYVLIGVGAGIIVIGSLGCLCTVKGKPILLYIFSFVLILVFIAELVVGISGFVYRSKLEASFAIGLDNALNTYATDDEIQKAVNGLQDGLKCCGKDGYEDWFSRTWDTQAPPRSVPLSCCMNEESGCKNTELGPNPTDIYTEGCYSKVTSFMQKNFGIIGGVTIGFAFLQLFGALLSCALAKNINKMQYEQVA
jgi:tetraspanin-7